MYRFLIACGLLAVLACPLMADQTADLNVTRVALFSSGVGYFECDADVAGDVSAELAFRTDQINDILKSLVVQDFGGGNIGVVSYASRDPIEKTLRSFGVDITGRPSLGELLDQLRGEPVEVHGPQKLSGVIVGVEKQREVVDNTVLEHDVLNLLTAEGLRQLRVAELGGITLTNEKVDNELRRALATLATAHDADKKTVLLRFNGTGPRKVRAAYLLEAPIWKTSYRLVLTDENKPFLQGWATVENATEEDWDNVHLSLVSGRPISFRMDLYTPIYIPRPIEQLELYASLRPPEYEAGFENKSMAADQDGRMRRVGGRGGAMALGGVAAARPAAPQEAWAEREESLSLEGAGVASVATAQEAGELFEYTIKTPVSIPRQHSAMLPIVNEEIEGRKVSIYNPQMHARHPLNGLEITNATGLNLMQGPVTLFDGDIYAGDAKLPDLKPGEKRLIAYALDLGTEVMVKQQPQPDQLVSLRIAKGMLWHRHKYVDERQYEIKNKMDRARSVLLEQAYSDDWTLLEPAEPYERTPNLLRFQVEVPASETATYKVKLERVASQSLRLERSGLDDIRFYLRSRVISPAVKEALERIIAMRTELDQLARARENLERSVNETVEEQARVRENLKTLPQNTDSYAAQIKKFDELERQIGDLRGKIDEARAAEEQQQQTLEAYLLSLEIE
ncbi:MAG: hypothetical protein PVJ57_20400 [Phycisphaerae bacterium]|jgi:hypothetical protein